MVQNDSLCFESAKVSYIQIFRIGIVMGEDWHLTVHLMIADIDTKLEGENKEVKFIFKDNICEF